MVGVKVQATIRNVFDLAGNPAANTSWNFVGASACSRAAFFDSFTSFAVSFDSFLVFISSSSDFLNSSDENSITLRIVNPDALTAPWSLNPQLQSISLVIRSKGLVSWQPAVNDNDQSLVTFPFMSQV